MDLSACSFLLTSSRMDAICCCMAFSCLHKTLQIQCAKSYLFTSTSLVRPPNISNKYLYKWGKKDSVSSFCHYIPYRKAKALCEETMKQAKWICPTPLTKIKSPFLSLFSPSFSGGGFFFSIKIAYIPPPWLSLGTDLSYSCLTNNLEPTIPHVMELERIISFHYRIQVDSQLKICGQR